MAVSVRAWAVVAMASMAGGQALAQTNGPAPFKAVEDLDRCVQSYRWDADGCLDAAKAYVKKHPKAQFEMGKRVRLNFKHWAALPFLDAGMGKAPTAAQCADPDVSYAVMSGLNLPESYAEKAVAERMFAGACFGSLREAAQKALAAAGPSSYEGQSICRVYKAKAITEPACQPAAAAAPVADAPAPVLPTVNLAQARYRQIKVFRGPEGARVTVGELSDPPDTWVVRFDGIRGDWNGKALVHQRDAGGRAETLWTLHNGKRWSTLTVQEGRRTAYVPGSMDGTVFGYSDEESQKATAQVLR